MISQIARVIVYWVLNYLNTLYITCVEKTEWGETESSSNGSKKFECKDSYRAGGTGSATPVLAGVYFSRKKFHFYKNQVMNKNVSMNFGLARLIILNGKSISRSARLLAAHAFNLLLCSQGALLCKKLSNK